VRQEIDLGPIPRYTIYNYLINKISENPLDIFLNIYDDDRFECHQTFIYDRQSRKKQIQSLEYLTFFIELDKCKKILNRAKKIKKSEVKRLSEELSEMTPKKLKLPCASSNKFDFDINPKHKEKLKKIFGLDKINHTKFADFKETEESLLLKKYRKQQLDIYKGLL
tara:strand:- start:539 stop:1036 length:498 start_codon:yes stop_codon:yes gene_type:complete